MLQVGAPASSFESLKGLRYKIMRLFRTTRPVEVYILTTASSKNAIIEVVREIRITRCR